MNPNTIETILMMVAVGSILAPFPWFVALPDDVEEKMTENDSQGLIFFIAGIGLFAVSYLTVTDVWHLVYNTVSLTGVVSTWSATVGGLLVGYGGIVMLPNFISHALLKQRNLKWYALTVGLIISAFLIL